MENLPRLSIIIPALNEEEKLPICLESIKQQDYPKELIETIVIDGGSTDRTVEMAQKFGTRVLDNPLVDCNPGKTIGMKAAKGDFFVHLDADNEIVEPRWLKKMVKPLLEDSSLFGVESPLLVDERATVVNRYSTLLRISDPVARFLASKPAVKDAGDYYLYEFKPGDRVVTGANGFLWNKNILMKYQDKWKDKFEEVSMATFLASMGPVKIAVPKDTGVYHDYCETISEFIVKRKKIGRKSLARVCRHEPTWLSGVSLGKKILAVGFCLTMLGPVIEGGGNTLRSRRVEWLLHPLFCFLAAAVYLDSFGRFTLKKLRDKLFS